MHHDLDYSDLSESSGTPRSASNPNSNITPRTSTLNGKTKALTDGQGREIFDVNYGDYKHLNVAKYRGGKFSGDSDDGSGMDKPGTYGQFTMLKVHRAKQGGPVKIVYNFHPTASFADDILTAKYVQNSISTGIDITDFRGGSGFLLIPGSGIKNSPIGVRIDSNGNRSFYSYRVWEYVNKRVPYWFFWR